MDTLDRYWKCRDVELTLSEMLSASDGMTVPQIKAWFKSLSKKNRRILEIHCAYSRESALNNNYGTLPSLNDIGDPKGSKTGLCYKPCRSCHSPYPTRGGFLCGKALNLCMDCFNAQGGAILQKGSFGKP